MKNAIAVLLTVELLLAGCTPSALFVRPKEWTPRSNIDSIIALSRPYLQGKRIFLDPGHGGEDRNNRGPAGDAVEADVNLRVGLALRDFLTQAGATVFITRTKDTSVTLKDRQAIAVASGAEIFVSLHHNATGSVDDVTNYCSTYYHAREGSPEYHPANHDIARYIQRDVSYAMRDASPPFSPTFDGTLSDNDIYPNSGFAVLRQNPLPAVLIEGSFFTHPPEERRLADPEFNRIEAWGIFLGLGKYFRAGYPQLSIISDTMFTVPRPTIVLSCSPRGSIDTRSLQLFLDGSQADAEMSEQSGFATVLLHGDLTGGMHEISGWIKNKAGNSSWPFKKRIVVMLPAAHLSLVAEPQALPPDPRAFVRVQCSANDAMGLPVADGSKIRFIVQNGSLDTTLATSHGTASMYVHPLMTHDSLVLRALSGSAAARIGIPVQQRGTWTFMTGVISSRKDSTAIAGAGIIVLTGEHGAGAGLHSSTWEDGRYIRYEKLSDTSVLAARHPGFFVRSIPLGHVPDYVQLDLSMVPVAGGTLSGKTYLVDARYRKEDPQSLRVNETVARELCKLLRAAGANSVLIIDSTLNEDARAALSARYPKGMYIRIDASTSGKEAGARIYWNIPNRAFAGSLLNGLTTMAGLDSTGVTGSSERFYRDVAMGTITMSLPAATSGYFAALPEEKTDAIAWGLFRGTLQAEGFTPSSTGRFRVTRAGAPVAGIPVTLDGTLTQLTNADGRVDFFGLDTPESQSVTVETPDAVINRIN